MSYQVGDVIGLPPEPPAGTTIKTRGEHRFRLTRKMDGYWYITRSVRPLTWKAIAELWFPVEIMKVPKS